MESHEARELQLYIDNTEAYYKETFIFDKAAKGFQGLILTAAKSYVREHGSMGDKWSNVFGVIARKHVADQFSKEFLDWYREDWPSLRPVKTPRRR